MGDALGGLLAFFVIVWCLEQNWLNICCMVVLKVLGKIPTKLRANIIASPLQISIAQAENVRKYIPKVNTSGTF